MFSLSLTNNVFGNEDVCDWESQKNNFQSSEIIKQESQTVFNFKNYQVSPLRFDCVLLEPINLDNKLISFNFLIDSDIKSDLTFTLIDNQGIKKRSAPILDWYDISTNKRAHIVLDPIDFNALEMFSDDKITKFRLEIFTNNIDSFQVSNPKILTIDEHPNFAPYENLPIQHTYPALFSLILISFPIGFVLINHSGFLKEENFVMKLPWILGFGFVIYVIVSYIISIFWLSFESILFFVIVELGILGIYLIKNKNNFSISSSLKSKQVIIFFSIVFLISGIISISVSETYGWPTGKHDPMRHTGMITLHMYNHGFDLFRESFPNASQPTQILEKNSFLPYNNIPGHQNYYPRGSHISTAGLSFFTGTLPAVSIVSTYSFILVLIPPMLVSLVYKFSRSIFLSSIMLMISFAIVGEGGWLDGILMSNIWRGNFASVVGILVLLTSFMIFISFFEKNKKFNLFIYFVLSIIALTLIYYPFIALPIFIAIVGFSIFYVTNRKKLFGIFGVLGSIFVLMPLWNSSLLNLVGMKLRIPYVHPKISLLLQPFDPNGIFFLFWISSAISLIFAGFLMQFKQYRSLAIIVLIVTTIHFISLSNELALEYAFYYKALRSFELMFLLSVVMNLIMLHYVFNTLKLSKYFSKSGKNTIIKAGGVVTIFILLLPGFQFWLDYMNSEVRGFNHVPGGNEKNLQFWLYENSDPNDLILNDINIQSSWYLGFRAQPLLNGIYQSNLLTDSYNVNSGKFEPIYPGSIETLRANEILSHPWDHENIEDVINELGIKYIYLSERKNYVESCTTLFKKTVAHCYGKTVYWPWYHHSGDARIAMYEENPNLKLVLRNGDSAIFKVI